MDARRAALGVLSAALVVGLTAPAGATTGSPAAPSASAGAPVPSSGFDFGVTPVATSGAYRNAFGYALSAGTVLADRVQITNGTAAAKQFYVYAADAYTSPVGGGFALRNRDEPRVDAAAWVALPVSRYEVGPHTAAIIPFTIGVPTNATPGDHTAAIVAEEIIPGNSSVDGQAIRTIHRVGARVYLRVAGALHPSLAVRNFRITHPSPVLPYVTGDQSATAVFALVNTGNTRVQLDKVTIAADAFIVGTVSSSSALRAKPGDPPNTGLPDQLLPGSQVLFTRQFPGLPPFERLSIRASVQGEDVVTHTAVVTRRSVAFWAVPWLPLLVVAVIVGLVVRRRRGPRAVSGSAQPLTPSPAPRDPSTVGIS